MKAYKLEVLVIDHENLGGKSIVETLENQKFPNYCISPQVKGIEAREIGEWTDDHPLNKAGSAENVYRALFSPTPPNANALSPFFEVKP